MSKNKEESGLTLTIEHDSTVFNPKYMETGALYPANLMSD